MGRADLARGVRIQDLVFDDKPQPLPVLFTALWPLQVPTHGGIRVRRHLEDSKTMRSSPHGSVALWRRSIRYLFQRCRYSLLLPGESQRRFIPRGRGCRQVLVTWRWKQKVSIISVFPVTKKWGCVKEFTVWLPKNKKTLVTHAGYLVLQVFKVAFVGRTRLAHHLVDREFNPNVQIS